MVLIARVTRITALGALILCGQLVAQTVPELPALPQPSAATARPAELDEHGPHEHLEKPMDEAPDGSSEHAMPMNDGMRGMDMQGQFGSYPMSREASGTSWQPEATPMEMLETRAGDWSLMLHGFANAIDDKQTGPRGGDKSFTESMLMLMANRPVGPGTLGLRSMLSLDPTMGKSGYPLLFQTGETADGVTPLVDRQHPHDALMELSSSYSVPLDDERNAFLYMGLPGEPALGPPAFMHRYSGMRNPEAPLTHHWFDSTHVTFGVATLGLSQGPLKLEGSWFNGREPDQYRWNIETRKFDSWSTRLSYNPTVHWALQASYGYLKSPEALEPATSVRRFTASAIYQTQLAGNEWATTVAWARNDKRGPDARSRLPGAFVESTYVIRDRQTVFGRLEQVDKDELFEQGNPLYSRAFVAKKLSLGYIYDFATIGATRWGLGGVIGLLHGPSVLDSSYGRRPMSYMAFVQARIASDMH